MDDITALTPNRMAAIEEFGRLQGHAQLDHIHHWLTATPDGLDDFEKIIPSLPAFRRYRGLREIPVEQITGSVDRSGDFDRNFRPLRRHLRDRWVNVSLLADRDAWAPIRVYQVGNRFYVEDGHHRVSVARARGMLSIPAEVWEYPLDRPAVLLPLSADRMETLPRAETGKKTAPDPNDGISA
jgi:hypothetical protein